MKKNSFKKIIFVLLFLFFSFEFVSAKSKGVLLEGLNEATSKSADPGPKIEITTKEPQLIIADIIAIILSFVGIGFTILIIYGGVMWILARGNKEKINKAKEIIIDGTIGLFIILLAYAIAEFVIREIAKIN